MRAAVAIVIGASVIALILPREWSSKLLSLVQVVVPFQDAANSAADSVDGAMSGDPQAVPYQRFEQIELENEAAQHRLAAMALRVEQLEEEVSVLAATRHWDAGGNTLGVRGRLIPAKVVTEDLLPWRASRVVNAGLLQGVDRGAAVTSHVFSVNTGEVDGLSSGAAVLLGESLLGFVESVGSHVARVKLLSDPGVQMRVRIGRITEDGFESADRYFWLTGKGDGMQIRDVEAERVEDGLVQVGDLVLSDPRNNRLPAAMSIGRIRTIEPDRDNPLLSILSIEPIVPDDSLRRVYIYLPERE